MKEILENPWVSGIGGGIISGIIVYFITKWLMKRNDNSRYLRELESANTEVISILKPYIADNGLPMEKVMLAIINSTARKYGVQVNDMHNICVFGEELIKEIMENVYVSSDKKREYAEQLVNYINNLSVEKNKKYISSEIVIRNDYGDKYRRLSSALLAIITLMLTSLSIVTTLMYDGNFNRSSDIELLFSIAMITLLVPVLTIILGSILKDIKPIRIKKRNQTK